MTAMPNALDLLDAWWAVSEPKRKEALARLSAMMEADEAQSAISDSATDPEAEARA